MLVIADAARAAGLRRRHGRRRLRGLERHDGHRVESAHFTPAQVRRTARRLGLATEASHRFERGADYDAAATALGPRPASWSQQIGAGHAASRLDRRAAQPPAPRPRADAAAARIARVLGYTVADGDVERILARARLRR